MPLLLPLEAIEVDAFRRRHAGDTFWCGLLLGGCGGQLTTKLYTDRVCHFAHHPDPDGLPHVCGRSARDISSADHLYLKAAAQAWLAGRGEEARFAFTQPQGAPIGSLLDIAFARGGRALRVHLDPVIAPVWSDASIEPVLGVSVPVDDDTLVRRWYVHRVRFDSAGTSRQVRIGTQAFARPTEWFGLDDCEMTDDGLRTPAVERIVRSRRTPPPRHIAFAPATAAAVSPAAEPDDRVRRLRDALRTGSVPAVTALCHEYESSPQPADEEDELAAALEEARTFLERQRTLREQLVQELLQAVKDRKSVKVRSLLVQAEIAVGHDRTKDEDDTIRAAGTFLEDQKRRASWEHRDAAPQVRGPKRYRTSPSALRTPRAAATTSPRPDPAAEAHHRMRDLLSDLRRLADRLPEHEVIRMIRQLQKAADEAGGHVTALQREEVDSWTTATHLRHPARSGRDPHDGQARSAQRRVRAALAHLRRASPQPLNRERRRLVELLEKDLREADGAVTPAQRRQAEGWIARLHEPPRRSDRASIPAARPRTASPPHDVAQQATGRQRKKATERERLTEDKIAEVAAAVRGALKKAARERTTTSWSRLRRQLGSALPHQLHPDDQIEILAQVDAGTPADEPLLMAVLAAGDTSSPVPYRRAAGRLGRDQPGNAQEARSQWQADVLRLHQLYRYK